MSLVYGALACLSWAFGNVLTKTVLSHVEPLAVLNGQLTVSVIALWTLSLARGATIRFGDWRAGLPGLLHPASAYACSTFGLALVPASLEAMIFAIETPLILLLAWPLLRERPSKSMAAFGSLAFIGVIILTWQPEIGGSTEHGFGVFLILSGVVFAALYSVAIRRMSADVDALRLTTASQTVGWLAVGAVWLATRQPHMADLTPADGLLIVGSGLLLNAIPSLLYGIVLERTSATFAALILPLVPVLTAALAYLTLGETLNFVQWTGAFLVVSSIVALSLQRSTRSLHFRWTPFVGQESG